MMFFYWLVRINSTVFANIFVDILYCREDMSRRHVESDGW